MTFVIYTKRTKTILTQYIHLKISLHVIFYHLEFPTTQNNSMIHYTRFFL